MVNHTSRLPPELWLIIFRFATSSPITYPSDSESPHYYYKPFQPCYETITALSDAAVRDRCAITLVCRQWHALAGDMRYEDIRVGHGMGALHAALSKPAAANTIVDGITDTDTNTNMSSESLPPPSRHRVRRAVLPYAYTATPTSHASPALALLALLPHLEVLVCLPFPPPITTTTFPPHFNFPTAAPALPALRRLEWAFDGIAGAATSAGINSLTDMLIAVPNLSELVLTGPMLFTAVRQEPLSLPALRTLHFQAGAGQCPFIMYQMSDWVMPMLKNIIVEGEVSAAVLGMLCVTLGRQVRVMELELGHGMLMNKLGVINRVCPALEEINLRIDMLSLDDYSPMNCFMHQVFFAHDALQRLGVYVDSDVREWSVETWMALLEFVAQWKGCPALHQVVLYVRNVEIAEQTSQFQLFREELSLSGRLLLLHSVCTLE
jgi:hypothetical protein